MKKNWLTAVATAVIVVLSTIPIPEEAPLSDVPLIDKWVHMLMYGGLSMAMWVERVLLNRRALSRFYTWMMLFYPVAVGGLMELVQAYWTTCRSGDWLDFEADAVGVMIGVLISLYLNKLWKEKTSVRK